VPKTPKGEGTNFDLFADSDAGERLYVEVKFTENAFGGAKPDKTHRAKLDEGYFFKHYQLLRNVSYADPSAMARVVFLLPRANARLVTALQEFQRYLLDSVRSAVAVVFLEDLLAALASSVRDERSLASACISLLKEKYVVR
jgi:hypothetical protein